MAQRCAAALSRPPAVPTQHAGRSFRFLTRLFSLFLARSAVLPAACLHSGPADPASAPADSPGLRALGVLAGLRFVPLPHTDGSARRGEHSTSQSPLAAPAPPSRPHPRPRPTWYSWHTSLSSELWASACSSSVCFCGETWGCSSQGGSPQPPLRALSPPYPVDDDPGDVLVRRVESVRQLGVAVHQGGPQLPLRAGGDAACIQLRGVNLQALGSQHHRVPLGWEGP